MALVSSWASLYRLARPRVPSANKGLRVCYLLSLDRCERNRPVVFIHRLIHQLVGCYRKMGVKDFQPNLASESVSNKDLVDWPHTRLQACIHLSDVTL
jgi:transposase